MRKPYYKYSYYLIVVTAILCFITSCTSSSTNENGMIYTCPMHPEIRKNEPGNCPICKMELVPAEGEKDSVNVGKLLNQTNRYVVSDVEAIKPISSKRQHSVEVHGIIAYDERLSNSVSARVDGRLEKLYVKYKFQAIKAGQRLFDLYSPELQNEQQNFIFLLKNETQTSTLIEAAKTKLRLLGLIDSQIKTIEATKQPINPVPYFSPYSGHLHIASETASNGDMQTMPSGSEQNIATIIKEGMYVKKGQVVFQINSTSKVWGMLNVSSTEASSLKVGDSVEIHLKSETIPARIDFIEPAFKNGQSFISVRVYLENKNEDLKIGENISAVFKPSSDYKLLLPTTAVVSLGIRNVVFVKEGNRYKAREIQTDSRSGEFVEVVTGLDSTTMVAKNASFLIDSESFVSPNE
jgi:membrane fusion protein, copper/silver efflux system